MESVSISRRHLGLWSRCIATRTVGRSGPRCSFLPLRAVVLLLGPFQVPFGGELGILGFAVGMAVLSIVEWYGLRRVQYP